jgi:translation initiation factor IF-1
VHPYRLWSENCDSGQGNRPPDTPDRGYTRCGKRTFFEEVLIAQKEEKVELTGEIVEALRNGMFRVALDGGHETLGYTAGKMRRYRIRMNPGDRVRIELSAYDLGRGRIVYRLRPGDER